MRDESISIPIGLDTDPRERVIYSPTCMLCLHLTDLRNHFCKAFPEKSGIPDDIWDGESKHRAPISGDHGFQFSPRPPRSRRIKGD